MRASPINTNGHSLRFDESADERNYSVLAVTGTEYHTMDDLVRDYPDVGSAERRAMFCEAWLRLNHGSGYRLIQDPAQFKSRYHLVKQRGYTGVRGRQSVPGSAAYDATEISEPQLFDDTLRCYVEDRVSGLPYRVELPLPMRADALVRFELLPLEDGGEDDDYI
jgi:hypothetical protein